VASTSPATGRQDHIRADLKYGVDYVNLGYKDGASAVMRAMGNNAGCIPTDQAGTRSRRSRS
jgi:hypothetical protein